MEWAWLTLNRLDLGKLGHRRSLDHLERMPGFHHREQCRHYDGDDGWVYSGFDDYRLRYPGQGCVGY